MNRPFDIIPQLLRGRQQWVLWRYAERDGKLTKVPYTPAGTPASVSDPSTWTDFETALKAYRRGGFDGIGFVLSPDDGIVCVDLDDARNGTGWKPEAMEIIRLLNTYTEISPSGYGLHAWALAKLPEGRRRRNGVEMYDAGRFITVTGNHLAGTPLELKQRTAELAELHRQIFGETTSTAKPAAPEPPTRDDEEIIRRAITARDGAKFRALWNGDTSGYPSQSEADLALCRLLAFWTGGDPERIERLFSQSALGQREKWQTRADYRRETIQTALQSLRETYSGNGNGHRQIPRQLRQDGRTDAEPSGAVETSGEDGKRATDQSGANGHTPRRPTRPDPNRWTQPATPTPPPTPTPTKSWDEWTDWPDDGATLHRSEPAEWADTVGADTDGTAATTPIPTVSAVFPGESSPGCSTEGASCTSHISTTSIVRKSEMIGYKVRNDRLQPVKCSATDSEMIGYKNEMIGYTQRGVSVGQMVLRYAATCRAFTIRELVCALGIERGAVRQAVYRLVRAGKLERRGATYSLPSVGTDDSVSPQEYAEASGISVNAARIRLMRMVRAGRALRLAHGRYFVLPDGWVLAWAQWDPSARRRDDRQREFYELELESPIGNVRVIRFYVSPARVDALCEASEFVGLERRRVLVLVAAKPKGGKRVYDCVGIISPSGDRLVWRDTH